MKIYVVIVDDEQDFESGAKLNMQIFFNEKDWVDRMASYDSIDINCYIENFDTKKDFISWLSKKLKEKYEDEQEREAYYE